MKALAFAALARLLQLEPKEAKEQPVVPSQLEAKLHGTLVARDPQYSAALIDRRTRYIGDELEGRTLIEIGRGCVVLERDHQREQLCTKPIASQARHARMTEFFSAQIRIVPVPDGFKLLNLPAGSIYERLGVQSGDIVRKVNGRAVDASTIGLVKPGALLRVQLERNGQLFELEGQLD